MKTTTLKITVILSIALFGVPLFLLPGMLQAATTEELTQTYIEAFSVGSEQAQLDALNILQWSGLSDPRIFDLVEQNLLSSYPSASSGDAVNLASWYAKTLGTSGLDKYRTTLRGVIDSPAHKKLKKNAQIGLDNLEKYAVWNPIISNPDTFKANESHEVNAYANMLRSDDWQLKTIAGKRITYERLIDPYLLDLLDEVIMANYQEDYSDKARIMGMAWMIRALASAGHPEYRELLDEVAANAGAAKVRKYTTKYLQQYY
jgi:hypothetical protein